MIHPPKQMEKLEASPGSIFPGGTWIENATLHATVPGRTGNSTAPKQQNSGGEEEGHVGVEHKRHKGCELTLGFSSKKMRCQQKQQQQESAVGCQAPGECTLASCEVYLPSDGANIINYWVFLIKLN